MMRIKVFSPLLCVCVCVRVPNVILSNNITLGSETIFYWTDEKWSLFKGIKYTANIIEQFSETKMKNPIYFYSLEYCSCNFTDFVYYF